MEESDASGEAVWLGTQEALAAHLGVERKSIQRWHKRKDCPGRVKEGFAIRDWEAFMERNKLGRKKTSSKLDLDAEKIALGNERMRLVNAKLRGEVEHRDEVVKVLGEMRACAMRSVVLSFSSGVLARWDNNRVCSVVMVEAWTACANARIMWWSFIHPVGWFLWES